MNNENKFILFISLEELLESKSSKIRDDEERPKALSEKLGQLLGTIPEIESFLDEKDPILRKKLFVEIGRYIKISKYKKGETIKHLGEGDRYFYMGIYGKMLKLNIVYKTIYASLKEYILYLSKLLIIEEKYLYIDCIKKNQKIFNINENINIISYGENIKSFDFKEEIEKIKKLYDEVFMLKLSEEEKSKKKLSISELLSLYNPIMEEKNNYFNTEQKYCVNLPFFYLDKVIDSICFVGNLNKNHGIKTYSTYISLNNCDMLYLDKNETKNDFIFTNFNINKSNIITNDLFKKHYIFKDFDSNFLQKNYSKFFEIIRVKKDENIILQNSVYQGVFFINKGVFELKTKRSYNEVNELKFNIMNNHTNLTNNLESFRDKKRDQIIQRLLRNPKFIKEANQVKDINFGTLIDTEIVGLTDLYDKNNGIYNFSVKCTSNEAELFFVPREIFNSILTNSDIEVKITKLTNEKVKLLNLKIKRFTDLFELEFDKLVSPKIKEEKKYILTNNVNIKQNTFNNNRTLSQDIPNDMNSINTPIKSRQKRLFKTGSYIKVIYPLKINSTHNDNNERYSSSIFNKIINPNKNNKNLYIINNNINKLMKTNISKNISRFSRKNKYKLNCESKFDEIINNNSTNLNRIPNLLSMNKNNKNNKNINHSISLFNIKPKSFNNYLNSDRSNYFRHIESRNIINKFATKKFKNRLNELSANRVYEKIFNYFPDKNIIKKERVNNESVTPMFNNFNFTIEDNHKIESFYSGNN